MVTVTLRIVIGTRSSRCYIPPADGTAWYAPPAIENLAHDRSDSLSTIPGTALLHHAGFILQRR